MKLLASELIKLNNLQLAGKVISDRLLLGIHSSRRISGGLEFEQYRHYFPGDELRRIDWKLYGRREKLYIKEAAAESNLHIKFVLDLSGSMNYEEDNISRLQYARILIASLAYMAFRQNDPMSLFVLKNSELSALVTENRNAFQQIIYHLENTNAAGTWQKSTFHLKEFNRKQKELLIFVSDFLQIDDEWLAYVKSVNSPYRQIVIFQILGKQEIEFDLSGFYKFKDLESGKTLELDAKVIKKEVQENAKIYLKKLDKELLLPHVHLIRCRMDRSIPQYIMEAMKKIKYE